MDTRESYREKARRQHAREAQQLAGCVSQLENKPNRTDAQERTLRRAKANQAALPHRLVRLLQQADGAYEFSLSASEPNVSQTQS